MKITELTYNQGWGAGAGVFWLLRAEAGARAARKISRLPRPAYNLISYQTAKLVKAVVTNLYDRRLG